MAQGEEIAGDLGSELVAESRRIAEDETQALELLSEGLADSH